MKTSRKGRPEDVSSRQSVYLLDCRSPHEVEKGLASEASILHSILTNRDENNCGPQLKTFATEESFGNWKPRVRADLRYVHIAAHANRRVLGFIEGGTAWDV